MPGKNIVLLRLVEATRKGVMMPNSWILSDGKKYLWDGIEYSSGEAASEKMKTYESDGFEVELLDEGGKSFLYTRRVVKEVIVAAA